MPSAPNAGTPITASIGPGGIEIGLHRLHRQFGGVLQSDQEELKFVTLPYLTTFARSFNRTRRN